MNLPDVINDPQIQALLWPVTIVLVVFIISLVLVKRIKKSAKIKADRQRESLKIKQDNLALSNEIRERIIAHINLISRLIRLNPVTPGNTPDDNSLEGRNRTKCLSLVLDGLPNDIKGQGIRMAEFLHHLSDYLVQAYGREGVVHLLIDSSPIILDVDSAAHVGLMYNELISNALKYAPVPGEKSKVNIIFKERENKLYISVADNGTGMKSPYISKFSFGLQFVNTLVQEHKGEMIITSRPGTRVEIFLQEYQKAEREVYITPTTKVY